MVGGVVSVGFGLRGGGMRWVGDRCNAVGQGSRDHAFNPASSSRETPCCCDIDQPGRKPADTAKLDALGPFASVVTFSDSGSSHL